MELAAIHQAFEAMGVDLVVADLQRVPGPVGAQDRRPQLLPQL